MRFPSHPHTKTVALALVSVCLLYSSCQRDREAAPLSDERLAEELDRLTPEGWKLYDSVLQFTAESLYEQINGRAEFFLAYNVEGLTCATYEKQDDENAFLNLSIYDMGTPTNAFGVFAGERSRDAENLEIGRATYRSGANCYVWRGRYYAQIEVLDDSDTDGRLGPEIAKIVAGFLPAGKEPVWGLEAFPEDDLIPDSIRYFKVDAMGLDFLRNTYTAQYRSGDGAVAAFIVRPESIDIAEATIAGYTEHAKRYGESVESLEVDGAPLTVCDMGGEYDVIFRKGALVGGVTRVLNRDVAMQAAVEIWNGIADIHTAMEKK